MSLAHSVDVISWARATAQRRRAFLVACVALVGSLGRPSFASADEPVVEDVIVLRDGTRAAGVLAEWSPTGDAVFVGAGNITRRVPASEITRVELAESRREAERAAAEITVRVALRGRDGARPYYFRRRAALYPLLGSSHTGSYELSDWQLLCRAPCTAHLEPGLEWLALSDRLTWSPMLARAPVTIAEGRTLIGATRSAFGLRVAAVVIAVASAVAGLLVALTPLIIGDERDVLMYGALGIAGVLVGVSISIPFFLASDHAELSSR